MVSAIGNAVENATQEGGGGGGGPPGVRDMEARAHETCLQLASLSTTVAAQVKKKKKR